MAAREIIIRIVQSSDRAEWLRLRSLLWDETEESEHLAEMEEILDHQDTQLVLVASERDSLIGFLEVSIRPHAEDCETDNVGYLEGWYVEQEYRRTGIGRSLVSNAEQWARDCGCVEMASDAEFGNEESIAAHSQLGYSETSRLAHFRRFIG